MELNQSVILEQDLALKEVSRIPQVQKPQFAWRDVFPGHARIEPQIRVLVADGDTDFDYSEVAETIGKALTNLGLSRKEEMDSIFSERNREFVASVAKDVGRSLAESAVGTEVARVTPADVYRSIARTLETHQAFDIAKSFLQNRAVKLSTAESARPVPGAPRVIKRNNQVVPWNEVKIETAVRKAFLSLQKDSSVAPEIARAVTERVVGMQTSFLHMEQVQDIVQEEIMRAGHFKVAEHYILYRAARSQMRGQELAKSEQLSGQNVMVLVKRPDGTSYFWDGMDLRRRIEFARLGLDLCLSNDDIESELRRSIFDDISQTDLNNTIVLNAKTLIERDADFAKFAGRIQLTFIYEEVLGWDIVRDGLGKLREAHQRQFVDYVRHGVRIRRLAPALLEYDLKKLAEALDPTADMDFDFLGIQTLYDRYLIIDKTVSVKRRIETPQFFWMRVAMGLFLREKQDREGWVIRLYDLYRSRRFCSSTPTLFNSGTLHSQLSSCYLYHVSDSIESIMVRGIAENAFLSKWAGGLGGSWTSVRGTGSHIAGTNGESQGVIPFLKLHNDQLLAVNQGGKRRGSGCAYLETWHNDVLEFLELRRNTGDDRRRTHDMNTANWIPDLFMKRVESRGVWTLFRSSEVPDLHELYGRAFEQRYEDYERQVREGLIWGQEVPAIELWKKMLSMLFETGHPWITFKDPCNVRSPQDHAGVIHSSNLCTEITLNTSAEETAVCNLGSVVLNTHLRADGAIDHAKLRDTIRVALRALDNVIDLNYYPTEPARTSNLRHRPVGLGIMGLADCLYLKGIAFASDTAVEFNDEVMEAVAFHAYEASSDLAAERGTYSTYAGSKWSRGLLPQDTIDLLEKERGVPVDVPRGGRLDWSPLREKIRRQGMRNSNVLAIAPTATISNIMGTVPCIEPTYKNLYVKSNLSGEFLELNTYLVRDLKNHGLWDGEMVAELKMHDGELGPIERIPVELREKYLTAFGIDYKWVVEAAARRQKWIDQAQSVNLWLPAADMKVLSHMYRMAWRKGLKTTYYLRTLAATSIEKATVAVKKDKRGVTTEAVAEKRVYTVEEKAACSLEAMRRGETCEACQ